MIENCFFLQFCSYYGFYLCRYSSQLMGNVKEVSLVKFIISLLLLVFALIDLIPFFGKLKFGNKSLPLGGVLSGF